MKNRIQTAARSRAGRLLFWVAAFAPGGCVATESRPVSGEVRTAAHEDGTRVWVRLGQENRRLDKPRVTVTAGSVANLAVSPDRRTVSLLWKDPAGSLLCVFPIYGAIAVPASARPAPRWVEYVLLREAGVEVTARLPAQVPMTGRLSVQIQLPARALPARFHFADRRSIPLSREKTDVTLEFETDAQGFLLEADTTGIIHTANGAEHWFLVGVDADGSIAAVTGFVRRW